MQIFRRVGVGMNGGVEPFFRGENLEIEITFVCLR